MLFFTEWLLAWVMSATIRVGALGKGKPEPLNWNVVPVDLQKSQLDTTYVVLTNDTWAPFFFDNVGSWAFPQFQITITNNTAFTRTQWVDAFCAGDAFTVYFLTNQGLNGSYNGRDPVGVASCNNYTLDPSVAASRAAFSWGSLNTAIRGTYNITIVPRMSPFSAGKGYIKVIYPT